MSVDQKHQLPKCEFVYEYVQYWAEKTPEQTALVLGEKRVSYHELLVSVYACAKALLASGISKGDRVATLAPPSPDFLVTFLAANAIGAVWVGLNPKYRENELCYVVEDSAPKLLFARSKVGDRDYSREIATMSEASDCLEAVVSLDGGIDAEWLENTVSTEKYEAVRGSLVKRDPAVIVYTSGSTGRPKGAMLCHEGIAEFSYYQNVIWPVSQLRALNYLPINHVGCLIDTSTPCIAAGGTIVFMEQFDALGSLRFIETEKITLWGSVPSVFQLQLSLPEFGDIDLSSVELIVWEGAAMPSETIAKLKTICPRLATNYGMTETTSAITVLSPTDDEEVLANSVGSAFPGVSLRLVDVGGKETDRQGEVQTFSKYNTLGYWNRPETSDEAFTDDGWFKTGDIAEKRPDGHYRIVGRIKEMYKSGGYNVYPREVEIALEEHPAVDTAVVVSKPDPLWDEVGVAFVLTAEPIDTGALLEFCKTKLANYKVPKQIRVCRDLPLLPIGKIDRTALQKMAMAG